MTLRYLFAVDRTDDVGRIWRSIPFQTLEEAEEARACIATRMKAGPDDTGLGWPRIKMLWSTSDGKYFCEAP